MTEENRRRRRTTRMLSSACGATKTARRDLITATTGNGITCRSMQNNTTKICSRVTKEPRRLSRGR